MDKCPQGKNCLPAYLLFTFLPFPMVLPHLCFHIFIALSFYCFKVDVTSFPPILFLLFSVRGFIQTTWWAITRNRKISYNPSYIFFDIRLRLQTPYLLGFIFFTLQRKHPLLRKIKTCPRSHSK